MDTSVTHTETKKITIDLTYSDIHELILQSVVNQERALIKDGYDTEVEIDFGQTGGRIDITATKTK